MLRARKQTVYYGLKVRIHEKVNNHIDAMLLMPITRISLPRG